MITKFTDKLLKQFILRVITILKNIFVEFYLIEGLENKSGKSISILIAGSKRTMYYLSKKIMSYEHDIKKIGRCSIRNIGNFLENNVDNCDIVFINVDRFLIRFLKQEKFYTIPEWIGMELDTSIPLFHIHKNFSRGAKDDIKKIDRFGFQYEVTTDPNKFDFFYNKMFLPHIIKAHGEETLETYIRYIKSLTNRSKLLLVKMDDAYLCGGLIQHNKNKLRLPSMGVLDSNEEIIKKRVISALYYFHILDAKENNIDSVDFGETRPFLNDGGFQFKRKWGMKAVPTKFESSVIGFKICKFNSAIEEFLKNNPMILEIDGKLVGVVFSQKNSSSTDGEIHQFVKSFYVLGLSEFLIISKYGFSDDCMSSSLYDKRLSYYNTEIKDIQLFDLDFKCFMIKPKP